MGSVTGNFIVGQPLTILDGHTHEGSVLDRMLTVRHSGRTTVPVCDPSWPISGSVLTGHTYEMVIVATAFGRLRYPLEPFDVGRLGTWRGSVVDPHWSAPIHAYHCARQALYTRRSKPRSWILLSTPIGHLLMNPLEVRSLIGFFVAREDVLLWQDARFDLYAVL